jgi:hypothetical protein
MKPEFLYPTTSGLRRLLARAKFILPNGGPAGFADVAAGRIDAYLSWCFPLTEVFSAIHIAEQAGCIVSHWDGSPVIFRPDIHAVYSLVCSANQPLHRAVLKALQRIHRASRSASRRLHAMARETGSRRSAEEARGSSRTVRRPSASAS